MFVRQLAHQSVWVWTHIDSYQIQKSCIWWISAQHASWTCGRRLEDTTLMLSWDAYMLKHVGHWRQGRPYYVLYNLMAFGRFTVTISPVVSLLFTSMYPVYPGIVVIRFTALVYFQVTRNISSLVALILSPCFNL